MLWCWGFCDSFVLMLQTYLFVYLFFQYLIVFYMFDWVQQKFICIWTDDFPSCPVYFIWVLNLPCCKNLLQCRLVHFFSQSSNFDHVNEWQVVAYIVYSKDWTSRKALVGRDINITGGKYQVHSILYMGHAVVQLFNALHYRPVGHGFHSRWGHWNFSLS